MPFWPCSYIIASYICVSKFKKRLLSKHLTKKGFNDVKNKGFILLFILVTTMILSSCGKYNFLKTVSEQDKKDHPEIYGEVGGPALQTKNTYPTNPDAATRSAVLKQLLFDENARGKYIDTAKALAGTKE